MSRNLPRFEVGVGLAIAALALQIVLGELFSWNSYQIFLAVVAISAIRSGKLSGFLTLILSVLAKWILFALPAYAGQGSSGPFMDRTFTFLLAGAAVCWIGGAMYEAAERQKELLARARLLSGLLPICASCKRIRDDSGRWCQMETYISMHSEAQFSHGYCPHCADEAMRELEHK